MASPQMPDRPLSRQLSDADAAAALAPAGPSLSPVVALAATKEETTGWLLAGLGLSRRALGICLLLVTVFLWTASNFMASFIFSDHTYNKPFFLVYINSSVFALSVIPHAIRYLLRNGLRGLRRDTLRMWRQRRLRTEMPKPTVVSDEEEETAGERLLVSDEEAASQVSEQCPTGTDKLGPRETAILSLEFSMLWFAANYLASACLGFTSVASVTILTSTSSMWTLVLCALYGVEKFSVRKLVGVSASLVGVALVSTVDLSGSSSENRGSFPYKTPGQIAAGDAMALMSAVVYGLYVTVMKRRVGREDRVDMRLFFGLVGVFNLVLLWPLFPVLHWTGIEKFSMPPTGKVWGVIAANSLSSFVSDMSWAFAMLLTTPLVVTVGLSLTIPLSLLVTSRLALSLPPHAPDATLYLVGALHMASLYAAVERAWDQARKADTPVAPVLQSLHLPGLMRAERIRGTSLLCPGAGPVAEFVRRVGGVVRERPHVLVAYAHVLFMALFAGGRYIGQRVEGAGLDFWRSVRGRQHRHGDDDDVDDEEDEEEKGEGEGEEEEKEVIPLRFFRFDAPNQDEDLKHQFKSLLSSSEPLLTTDQKRDIIREATLIFESVGRIVTQLDAVCASLQHHHLHHHHHHHHPHHAPSTDIPSPTEELLGSRLRDSIAVTRQRWEKEHRHRPARPSEEASSLESVAAAADGGGVADLVVDGPVVEAVRFRRSLALRDWAAVGVAAVLLFALAAAAGRWSWLGG
ncbi:vacuolar membrane protein [Ophiocordyceps camponoti-floridani]|uniref:Vacuolar membrane protein n=1 Tax=Ophiocordyceps camponoti-floridani TaxID=2030778 RepID=A0A8H4Q1X6_9HYPO|nr:vacuolar membrane protein [Ophiocordyceps camponoti-floridani]